MSGGNNGITTNLKLAVSQGYIGEELILPCPIPEAVCRGLNRRLLPIRLYYHGKPTPQLRKKFNIPPGKIDRTIRRVPHN